MADAVLAYVTKSIRINEEAYISGANTLDGDNAQLPKQVIAGGASEVDLALDAITLSKLKAFYMVSDQDLTVVFTLNSGIKTYELLAGIPEQWDDTYATAHPCPFKINDAAGAATGIVSAAATNEGTAAATLTIRALVSA